MLPIDAYTKVHARMPITFGPRHGETFDIGDVMREVGPPLTPEDIKYVEEIDLVYRTLCCVLYNFVPMSGHPGGSISSGRIVEGLLYGSMDYEFAAPDRQDNDLLAYAAGHKALGLYAMWALRNELVRLADPSLLAPEARQLRFEDLLGFRRNPVQDTPLFRRFHAMALDGHPTPATPFVKLATGASGVGCAAAIGLALGARDYYGGNAPKIHVLEGEGGMTPGRVSEAMAAAGAARLDNLVLHVDWNQASIDSNAVCRDGNVPGDYVQWNPLELARLHDFNVIYVRNGLSIPDVWAAQALAASIESAQPTAVVYRTIKGWQYGIEGRASHGAGHSFCGSEYDCCLAWGFEKTYGVHLPHYTAEKVEPVALEKTYWDTLSMMRKVLARRKDLCAWAAGRVRGSLDRLNGLGRKPRKKAPAIGRIYRKGVLDPAAPPASLVLKPGTSTTLRGALGGVLNHLNHVTGGALLACSADLLESTSVAATAKGFPSGFYNATSNPLARLVAVGGICEDAMGALMSGVTSYGVQMGVTSSYGAFIAALEHVAARLHGIGEQARAGVTGLPMRPMVIVNGHAGVKTGEDGPTHADPQALQLFQENFPKGVMITLTPMEPAELWPLVAVALAKRPAIIAPFVTRPNETVPDRVALGLPPASAAAQGVYPLVTADPDAERHGTVVLQGSEVGLEFVQGVLPWVRAEKLNLNVYYVASAELFDLLPAATRAKFYPEAHAREAIGITGFTPSTLYRWVTGEAGRARIVSPFRGGHYLGSGRAEMVMREAGLDAKALIAAIGDYIGDFRRGRAGKG
jgi:transketolase